MTQTRPVNLFEDSPHDTQDDSQPHYTLSGDPASVNRDESQVALTQTQLENTQTPTQAHRVGGLQRSKAMLLVEPLSDAIMEEEGEGEEEEEEEDAGEEDEEEMELPSAQPPRLKNAFDLLKSHSTTKPDREVGGKKGRNAFIDAEADLSDEEVMGMMMNSGDEDEGAEDLDADLEGLMDDEEVAADLRAKQDALARERAAYEFFILLSALDLSYS
jgi:hypothetical protein